MGESVVYVLILASKFLSLPKAGRMFSVCLVCLMRCDVCRKCTRPGRGRKEVVRGRLKAGSSW